jgi:hypothetical protein
MSPSDAPFGSVRAGQLATGAKGFAQLESLKSRFTEANAARA